MDKAHKQPDQHMKLRLKPRIMAQACSVALAAMSIGYASNAAADAARIGASDQ